MKLEYKNYRFLKEGIYQTKLDNGLTVCLLPKQDYNEVYAMIVVQFGAMDTRFTLSENETKHHLPSGFAHFLEHKLFELKNGKDAMQVFTSLGASSNAYTNLHQTCYLFSTSGDYLPPLSLLEELVSEPHFTEESVEREQAIIKQEIEMYADDADYRLHIGILGSLYPETPLAEDIAGTEASISQIQASTLKDYFPLFYHPSQMLLFMTGNFDLEQVWHQIQQSNLARYDKELVAIKRHPLKLNPVIKNKKEYAEVAIPKLAVGLRCNRLFTQSLQEYRISLQILFSMLFGWTSTRYQNLYERGIIDSSFNFDIEILPNCHYFIITADTMEPIALSSILRKALRTIDIDTDVNEKHFQLVKNEVYGDFIRSLNSLEFTASYFTTHFSEEETIFELPDFLETLTFEEVLEKGRQFVANCEMTDFMIFPK